MTGTTTAPATVETARHSHFDCRFLGVGGNGAALGPTAVIEFGGIPLLQIDCPPGALDAHVETYGDAPRALYLTHTHLDHIGGMEELFHAIVTDVDKNPARAVRLYAHANIVPRLQERLGANQYIRVEGGANFWDAFRLVPVSDGFWLDGLWFQVFESRHMQPRFCYGMALPGVFVFTGDTRPIPEVLSVYAAKGETVFHDCGLRANPAHTGFVDLLNEYSADLLNQIVCYHYGSENEAVRLEEHGFRVARAGQRLGLPACGNQVAA
jgi:hypothetical protein